MKAGKLRHRVTIQDPPVEGERDEYGTPGVTDWTDVAGGARPANVVPLSGKEVAVARQLQTTVTHRITMRYEPGLVLTPAQRLVFSDRILNIDAVINVKELNREWRIEATELT